MSFDGWASTTTRQPDPGPCEKCHGPGREQVVIHGPQGLEWRCRRCFNRTRVDLPFSPTAAPEGRQEGHLAADTLAIYVPIFAPINRESIYLILRAYFTADWCVRDVLHAMDYLPSGGNHFDRGKAWVRGEPVDTTLARLRDRLHQWRWGAEGNPDRDEIMAGPYTAMVAAMQTRADGLKQRQAARETEWHQQEHAAQQSRDRGASAGALRAATLARIQAQRTRAEANAREQAAIADQVAEVRSPFGPIAATEPVEDSTPA